MQKLFIGTIALVFSASVVRAQDDVYPAKKYDGKLFIVGGTIHVGNGKVIREGVIVVTHGTIVSVMGNDGKAPADARVIDAHGKQVYPGLILPVTDLGLKEIAESVRGTNDFLELGDLNPEIRSIVAYNTDSKIINTLKANGILLACVAPQGGTISGSSSVVQLDAWNWEDAAYKMENGIHVHMPSFIVRLGRRGGFGLPGAAAPPDPTKEALDKIAEIKSFFADA